MRVLTFSIDVQNALNLTLTVPDSVETDDIQEVLDGYFPSAELEAKAKQWILDDLKSSGINVYGFYAENGGEMPSSWVLDEEESGNLFASSDEVLN